MQNSVKLFQMIAPFGKRPLQTFGTASSKERISQTILLFICFLFPKQYDFFVVEEIWLIGEFHFSKHCSNPFSYNEYPQVIFITYDLQTNTDFIIFFCILIIYDIYNLCRHGYFFLKNAALQRTAGW